jgi:hypothetical protein
MFLPAPWDPVSDRMCPPSVSSTTKVTNFMLECLPWIIDSKLSGGRKGNSSVLWNLNIHCRLHVGPYSESADFNSHCYIAFLWSLLLSRSRFTKCGTTTPCRPLTFNWRFCLVCSACWFLAWLILRTWRWSDMFLRNVYWNCHVVCVTIDRVWIGEWIYWKVLITNNYNTIADFHTLQFTTR